MGKFGPKESKLSNLAENWHIECLDDVDSYSNPKSIFGKSWAEKVKAVSFTWKLVHTRIHIQYLEDVNSYFDISFLKFQTKILRVLILILKLVFWNSKPKSIFLKNLSQETWILYFEYFEEDVIVRIQSKVWKKR